MQCLALMLTRHKAPNGNASALDILTLRSRERDTTRTPAHPCSLTRRHDQTTGVKYKSCLRGQAARVYMCCIPLSCEYLIIRLRWSY
jgi:hypothetical protein